jgi:hypothetical protein
MGQACGSPGIHQAMRHAPFLFTSTLVLGAIAFGEHYAVGLMFDDPKNLMLYEACDRQLQEHPNLCATCPATSSCGFSTATASTRA